MRHVGLESIGNGGIPEEKPQNTDAGAVKGAVALSPPMPADADLQAVVDAWPSLPAPIRAAMLAMVKAGK